MKTKQQIIERANTYIELEICNTTTKKYSIQTALEEIKADFKKEISNLLIKIQTLGGVPEYIHKDMSCFNELIDDIKKINNEVTM